MALPTLTALVSGHGFTAGDLDTSGYVAMLPAYQKVYFADGRPYSAVKADSGYHILDFISTRLVGTVTGTFEAGETVTQTGSDAKGTFIETIGSGATAWHLIYRTTTAEFEAGKQVNGADSGAHVTPAASANIVAPPHWLNWTAEEVVTVVYNFEGVADSGSNTTLVDTDLKATYTADDVLNDWYIYIISGTGKGSYAVITGYTAATGTIAVADWLGGGDDPSTDSKYGISSVAKLSATGKFPDGGSNIMALCFNRIFMNSVDNPHQWTATRAGNPRDLLVSQDDVGTPVNSQLSKAGLVGDEITAMISYKDNYLIFGCLNEVWILRSDPAAGGIITNLSKETGIFSNTAWCWDDQNNLYFLGNDGVYCITSVGVINAHPPVNLTKAHLPDLVSSLGLNRRTDRVCMAYDKLRYGIQVTVSSMDGQWSVSFWVDLRTGSVESEDIKAAVFPETFPSKQHSASMMYFNSRRADQRGLLFGCYDGYIRKIDDTLKSDDGSNAINSYFTIGPIVNTVSSRSAVGIANLSLIVGDDTDSITVGVFTGKTAQRVINSIDDGDSPSISRTLVGNNIKPIFKHKISGGSILFKFGNPSVDSSFSMERINTDIIPGGRIR